MKPTMSVAPARLMTRLPAPHAAAASTTSARPAEADGAAVGLDRHQADAGEGQRHARDLEAARAARRARIAANSSVKSAWACSTSEARPAGTPTSMPMNSSENLTTPMITPTATIQRHGTERGRASTSRASDASA